VRQQQESYNLAVESSAGQQRCNVFKANLLKGLLAIT